MHGYKVIGLWHILTFGGSQLFKILRGHLAAFWGQENYRLASNSAKTSLNSILTPWIDFWRLHFWGVTSYHILHQYFDRFWSLDLACIHRWMFQSSILFQIWWCITVQHFVDLEGEKSRACGEGHAENCFRLLIQTKIINCSLWHVTI